MVRGRAWYIAVAVLAASMTPVVRGTAQEIVTVQYAERGPRFLLAKNERDPVVRVDVSRTPVLRRRVTVDYEAITLADALKRLTESAGLQLAFSTAVLPTEKVVRLKADGITVAAALTELLIDVDVDVLFSESGGAVLITKADAAKRFPVRVVGTISGRVTEAKTGYAVPSAQVMVVGTPLGKTTDDSGRYAIAGVPAGTRTISVRRLGYDASSKSVEVRDGENTTLDFALVGATTRLSEIVTTVTGGQRRVEIGNTVGRIDADKVVQDGAVTTLSDVISGRVAGVQVMYNAGVTGSSPRIRIRGQNSFTVPNDPLLVIDGVRVENSPGTDNNFSAFGWSSGRLNDLNPEEIESIEIVKGPSAATLYGTDAANGVLLVRTKRGATGPSAWRISVEQGQLNPLLRHFRPNYQSWGRTTTGVATQCLLLAKAAGTCTIDSVTSWSPFNNAETTPLADGSRDLYGLQVQGGAPRLNYFVSGDLEQETGPLKMPAAEVARISSERGGVGVPDAQRRPNYLRKVSARSTASIELSPLADLTLSSGLVSSSERIPSNGIFSSGILIGAGYRDANDGWGLGRPGERFAVMGAEGVVHSTSSVTANWRPWEWVQTRATEGLDFSSLLFDGLQRRGEGSLGAGRNGQRSTTRTNIALYTTDLGATLTRMVAAVSSRTSIGAQYNRRLQRLTSVSATGLPPGSETVAGGATVTGSERTVESVVAGGYVEEMVGLRDRLFLTGAVRADGASAFGKSFRTAFYPKASISWLAQDAGTAWWDGGVRNLRIRAAYGASGVQPSATAALAQITLSSVFVDGTASTGGQLTALGNPSLKPERTAELEAGADVDLLTERVHLEGTYYRKRSSDALVNTPLAASSGMGFPGSRQENVGAVENRGVEGAVNVRILSRPNIGWDFTVNGSKNTNRLLHLAPGVTGSARVSPFQVKGYPLYGIWTLPIMAYNDANGDGILTATEVTVGNSLTFFGSNVPRTALGIASDITLLRGQLRIATQFDYRGDYQQLDLAELNRCALRRCRAVNDPKAPLDEQAAAVTWTATNSYAGYVVNGAYVRWRELSATYNLPPALTAQLRSKKASVTFAGRNLRLWSHFADGIDPEANSIPANPFSDVVQLSPAAPLPRYITVRVNLGF